MKSKTDIPSEKSCTLCKQDKPRSAFRLRRGIYDYRCVACRRKPFSQIQLKKRLQDGMISEDEYAKQVQKAAALRAKAGAANLQKHHYDKTAPAWTRAERSARFALKLLSARPITSEKEHEWCEDAKQLIRQSLAKIEENKHKRVVPDTVCLFWYDVGIDLREQLHALVACYPGGEENSPLKVM